MRAAIIASLALLLSACTGCKSSSGASGATQIRLPDASIGGHPRLWVRAADLPRLRAWATSGNPMWRDFIGLVDKAKSDMDAGKLPAGDRCMDDEGAQGCEEWAEMLAFASLVAPSEKERHDDATRAIKLLMAVIDRAAKGPSPDDELRRDDKFPIDDRSRWNGEAFGLTVDWVYPYLTADEKRTIRKVFLRWCDVLTHAETTNNNHPEPIGVVDDPQLVADKPRLRWTSNNYYTAHARNMLLMALSFDAADDPGRELGAYVKRGTGAWLYTIDAYLRGDGRGGLPVDGLEYGPQSLAYLTQALWALHTAAADDAALFGQQARLDANPYWKQLVEGWPHIMSPSTVEHPYQGKVNLPAWWGEGQHYYAPDVVDLFAPISLYDRDVGDAAGAEAARWIALNLGPGGASGAAERARTPDFPRRALLYFMLQDPKEKPPADPRKGTTFFSPGLGKIFARTDWTPRASLFDFGIGWISVDHQHADGNAFQWWRRGEWLVKERTGYGEHIDATDAHDGVCIQNAEPEHAKGDPNDYRNILWKRGSQYIVGLGDADGKLVAHSENARYVYALGDAVGLYNSDHEGIHDVAQASRAIVWLAPDHVVTYDRAATKVDGRFKRWFVQTTARAKVEGRRATEKTPGGQYLTIWSLLPGDGQMTSEPAEKWAEDEAAEFDPITARVRVESWARDVRFLHVLAASDKPSTETPALVDAGPAFAATMAGDVVVVFPRDLGADVADVSLQPPAGAKTLMVTGLAPNGDYSLVREGARVHFKKGGSVKADGGGVVYAPMP